MIIYNHQNKKGVRRIVDGEHFVKEKWVRENFNLSKATEKQIREEMLEFCGVDNRYAPDSVRRKNNMRNCQWEYWLSDLIDYLQHRSELRDSYHTRTYIRSGKYKNGKI